MGKGFAFRVAGATLLAVLLGAAGWGADAPHDAAALAEHLLAQGEGPSGVVVVVNSRPPDLAVAIARIPRLFVHALVSGPEGAGRAKHLATEARIPLDRLLVEQMPDSVLPHADAMVDVLVCVDPTEDDLNAFSLPEVLRVLRPSGTAVIGVTGGQAGACGKAALQKWHKAHKGDGTGIAHDRLGTWVTVTKPAREGTDDWSHWEHAPDNNPVSTDTGVPGFHTNQWLGLPYYIAMPAITTASDGRTFTAMGHIAHHTREEPWLNTVMARNGYNGAELWSKRLPDGYLVHRSAFVATPETFYMIDVDGEGCLMLDPETGAQQGRIEIPEAPGEWKWMALHDGVLYVLTGCEKDPAETTIVRSQGGHWSWFELSQGYYRPKIPWGFGETIAAYNLKKGKTLWTHREDTRIDARGMAIGDGKVFFYCPDAHLGALDAKEGSAAWTNADAKVRALIEQPGKGLTSTPGFRTQCICVYTPKGLFYQGQTRQNLVAVSKDDGSLMWHRKKSTNNPNVIYLTGGGVEDGNILVGIGKDGSTLVLNPLTGETIKDLEFGKRSCARLTATPHSVFCRAVPEGMTRYCRASGEARIDGALRPACNDGVIGANGLLYVGPWLCDCNLSLMGTVALAAAAEVEPIPAGERLERDPDTGRSVESLKETKSDWPTYRGGPLRTASTPVEVSGTMSRAWVWRGDMPFTPTAPVAVGDFVFLAGRDGVIRAISAATGEQRWTYATRGPILQAPTVWKGRLYAGSGDGCVYALEAATGRLLWRFMAAPVDQRIMVYGNLCSKWPVNTGVLVDDGVAYCAAGLVDYDGTYVYALDAKTGEVLWENGGTGHLNDWLHKGVSAQGILTASKGSLWMAGGNIISPAVFNRKTGAYTGPVSTEGIPGANRGEDIGVLLDDYLIFGGRLQHSAVENVVNPGQFAVAGKGKAFVFSRGRTTPAWDKEQVVYLPDRNSVPQSVESRGLAEGKPREGALWVAKGLAGTETVALALARNAVVAVVRGEMKLHRVVHASWNVVILSRETGEVISQMGLPLEETDEETRKALIGRFLLSETPLPNGMAIDRTGRVLVAMTDGALVCLGPK